MDVWRSAEAAAQGAAALGIVAAVGEHGPDPGHNGKGGQEQALKQPGVVDVGCGAGINDRVGASVWDETVSALVTAIKARRPGDGIVAAVERCGSVLAAHFPPGALKRDELSDKLVEL